jgi:hypothetical protein
VLTRAGSTWSQQGAKLTGSGELGGGEFGWSVALSSDGNTELMGGPFDDNHAGAAWVFVSVVNLPTVTSVNPSSGSTAGGTSVSISGTNFTGVTAVKFGSASATSFKVSSATSITAVSPAGTGTVHVTVTTPEGTSATSAADQFSYVAAEPAPTVTKVSPRMGPVGGGTTVAVTGTNFTGATAVKFGSIGAASFAVNSPTSITAVSPAEAAGTADVTVTTSAGTSAISSADHFKFTPTVTKVVPNEGSKAGGTSVTVTGTGFVVGATTIKFGSTLASSVKCTSWKGSEPKVETTCTVTAPAHEVGTVDVTASVNKVRSPKTTADRFTYS